MINDGPYICLWCSKDHYLHEDPYDFGYCTEKCFKRYQKYGSIREKITAPRRLFYRLKHRLLNYLTAPKCPHCHTKMEWILYREYLSCPECWRSYEVHHYTIL